jgi:MFS family permease
MSASHPLKVSNYRNFVITRFFLTLSYQILSVVIAWHVYKITNDVFALGLIGLAEALPAISIALFAGHFADKHNRKKILQFSLLFILFGALGLLVVTKASFDLNFQLGLIYFFVMIVGLGRGFYAPSAQAILNQLVSKEQLVKGSTLYSTTWQIASIVGPAMAGLFYNYLGITNCFIIITALLLVAFVFLRSIKVKKHFVTVNSQSIWLNLAEGIKYVFNHKIILSALSLDLFSVLFGGAVALLPAFAKEILLVDAQGLGYLRAAPSLGASITMIVFSLFGKFKNPGQTLILAVAGFGACMIGFGLSTNFYLSLVLLFLSGAFDSFSVMIRGAIMQIFVPDNMRGRVSSINSIFIGSSNEIGAFESGLAARFLGLAPSVVFGGGITLVVVLIAQWKAKALKKMNFP